MKKLSIIGFAVFLVSCGIKSIPDNYQFLGNNLHEKLLEEVTNRSLYVQESVPFLMYPRRCNGSSWLYTIPVRDEKNRMFEILEIKCISYSLPGNAMILIYLKDPARGIVDWRCRFSPTRWDFFNSHMTDLNEDGSDEICITSRSPDGTIKFSAAYCVRAGMFDPVILEDDSSVSVRFETAVLDNGLVIKPLLDKTYELHSGLLYDIPVKVINSGNEPVILDDMSVYLKTEGTRTFFQNSSKSFDDLKLNPGESIDTSVTIQLTGSGSGNFHFDLRNDCEFNAMISEVARSEMKEELEANRVKWQSLSLSSYDIVLADDACYCLHALGYGPIENHVWKGKITISVYLGETRDGYRIGDMVKEKSHLIATVEELFADVEKLIENAPIGTYRVIYDREYGFPSIIEFDDPAWADEQFRTSVVDFKARK